MEADWTLAERVGTLPVSAYRLICLVACLAAASGDAAGGAPRDFKNRTTCHRCGSGNFDHTGIPFRTTPFVNNQNKVPGVAFCTSGTRKLGAFFPPSACAPWHSA